MGSCFEIFAKMIEKLSKLSKFFILLAIFCCLVNCINAEKTYMTEEEYETENEELRDVFTRYKVQVQYGTVDNSLQTADVNAVEVALANILANRALALKNGEISHEKSKRMVKEQRFRHRLLKDAGLMEWPMENEQKF